MLLIKILLPLFILYNHSTVNDSTLFGSPLKIPLVLSANFGEIRTNHFHSGLDIKTQGVTGKEVTAAGDGYVYRIGVQPGGFGNSLYIRHPSGYSTVYGHLDRFIPEIEKYVKDKQYEQKSFTVNLFPPSNKFVFKKGELIAYSGNSGGSTGPHLHFEIRESKTEKPVNPLLFHFDISDTKKPVIEKVVIYPTDRQALVNNRNKKSIIQVIGKDGSYHIPETNVIKVKGNIGFGLKTYDLLDESRNRCGVYSLELKVDSITVYKNVIDRFSYNETKYVNSHIDYEMAIKNRTYIQRMFIQPNDRLNTYREFSNRGIFNFNDSLSHSIDIEISDTYGNMSVLSFMVKGDTSETVHTVSSHDEDYTVMPFDRENVFFSDNITVSIPAYSLYDTLFFNYEVEEGSGSMFSDIHHIHNVYTPVHKPYYIAICPDSIPEGKKTKMVIVKYDNGRKTATKGTFTHDGFLSAQVSSFGNYYIGIDTVPPKIIPLRPISGVNMSSKKDMRFRISDNLTGIKSYNGYIDGEWVLFEYDQKNDIIKYKFDPERLKKSVAHKIKLQVTDIVNNTNEYEAEFEW